MVVAWGRPRFPLARPFLLLPCHPEAVTYPFVNQHLTTQRDVSFIHQLIPCLNPNCDNKADLPFSSSSSVGELGTIKGVWLKLSGVGAT